MELRGLHDSGELVATPRLETVHEKELLQNS